MRRLVENRGWMRAVAEVGAVEGIWYEDVVADGSLRSLAVLKCGKFHVFFVKVSNAIYPERPHRTSSREFVACCTQSCNGLRTTAEIKKELREGEEWISSLSIQRTDSSQAMKTISVRFSRA